MALEAAYEIAHFGQGHCLVGIKTLGLHIDDVESEFVLLDDAVHAAVAYPAERLAHLDPSAAVAHAHEKVDDQAFEESRTEGMHAPDNVARQLGIEELEIRSDRLLRVVPRFHLLRRLAGLGLRSPRDEFRIAFQKSEVDLAHPLGEQLAASVGGAAIAPSGQFDEPRLRQVGPRPVETVGE